MSNELSFSFNEDYLDGRKSEVKDITSHFVKLLALMAIGWLIGYFNFGFSLIFLFLLMYTLSIYFQWKKRRRWKRGVGLCQNERKQIMNAVKELPSWVYFPDVEKAEWLNKVIAQIWPFFTSYVNDFLMSKMQPLLDESLPNIARPFRFEKVDLGDLAPRVGGIKTYSGEKIRRDEIVLDIEIFLYSDAGIIVSMRKIPTGIKDFEFRGTMRVTLNPLLSKLPLFGAASICFLNTPYINFQFTKVGTVLDIPVIAEASRNILEDLVISSMVLPNRINIPLLQEINLNTMRHSLPHGVLRIHVISASKLRASDVRLFKEDSSDPYCIVRTGSHKFHTKVVPRCLNPVWDEYFEAPIQERLGQCLEILVYDKDAMNKGDFLGRANIEIKDVARRGTIDSWVPLVGVSTGAVRLKLTWMELTTRTEDFDKLTQINRAISLEKHIDLCRGFLLVVVDSGSNLIPSNKGTEPSPCGKVTLRNTTIQLPMKPNTPNPVWDKVCHFLVYDLDMDVLTIDIYNGEDGRVLLGRCRLPVHFLLNEQNFSTERAFPLTDSPSSGATLYVRASLRALRSDENVKSKSEASIPALVEEEFITPTQVSPLTETARNGKGEDKSPTTSPENRSKTTSRESSPLSSSPDTNLPLSPIPVEERTMVKPVIVLDSNDLPRSDEGEFEGPMLRMSLHYDLQKEALLLEVQQAKNLIPVDKDGVCDPFVRIFIKSKQTIIGNKRWKTKIVKNTLQPHFDERFQLRLDPSHLSEAILIAELRNDVKMFQRGITRIGEVRLLLSNELTEVLHNDWFPLTTFSTVKATSGL